MSVPKRYWVREYVPSYGCVIYRFFDEFSDPNTTPQSYRRLISIIEESDSISYRMDLDMEYKWVPSNTIDEAKKACEEEYIRYIRDIKMDSINDEVD